MPNEYHTQFYTTKKHGESHIPWSVSVSIIIMKYLMTVLYYFSHRVLLFSFVGKKNCHVVFKTRWGEHSPGAV